MRKLLTAATLALSGLLQAACLNGDVTHTLYLSPDGTVNWVTLEDDVRSDEQEPGRSAEESEYLQQALSGTHDVAQALADLDADRVFTRVLRRVRPFTVRTEAQFASAEGLAQRIIAAFGVPGDAWTIRSDGSVTLHVHLDLRGAADDEPGDGKEKTIGALVADISAYRIVLTEGTFVSAVGFTLDQEGRIARPLDMTEEDSSGVVDLSLTWK